jgi:CheY-like chemotaxis protein
MARIVARGTGEADHGYTPGERTATGVQLMALRRRNQTHGRQRPRLPQARPATAPPSSSRPAGPPAPRRKTVLVLEDNATIGGLMVALLREEGYRALRAWDIREAIKVARDRKPDLILLDLSLPYREGLPILGELKSHPETKECPLIVISGNTLQLAPDERALLVECISKPVDIDRLVNYVRRALGDPELEVPDKQYSGLADSSLHTW